MSKKKILSIGIDLELEEIECINLSSSASLLDWDVILISPAFWDFYTGADRHQGKYCFTDYSSAKVRQQCSHWSREISEAVKHGKTVICFLTKKEEFYIATGEKSYSGTGRNQRTTRHVTLFTNYELFPCEMKATVSQGKEIKLTPKNSEVISSFWNEFSNLASYNVVLDLDGFTPILTTRVGDKCVGAIQRNHTSNGSLIFLPEIDFENKKFVTEEDDEGNVYWTNEGIQFRRRFLQSIVDIDKIAHNSGEITPEPDWAKHEFYKFEDEKVITSELISIEEELEGILAKKQIVMSKLSEVNSLRGLLYEKGKPLEKCILRSLEILGFAAQPFHNSESEFDVVFFTDKGRLIGEAEGKDNKAINVDKLRQLSMNVNEDLMREEVDAPAKGVLFGNGYRMTEPSDRGDAFTEKCHLAAKANGTLLVPTCELFKVVKSLLNEPSEDYAAKCRQSFFDGVGLVEFPQRDLGIADELQAVD